MNTTAEQLLQSLLKRRPFVVLGYSAEGSSWCPACLRAAAGLSPQRGIDYDGNPIVPLHARDVSVQDELCDNCGRSLLELLLGHEAARALTAATVTGALHLYGQAWSLSFDGVPPIYVRAQLKQDAWRWDPRYRLWWCTIAKPEIPAGITLRSIDASRPEIVPRPPTRRRAAAEPTDTCNSDNAAIMKQTELGE